MAQDLLTEILSQDFDSDIQLRSIEEEDLILAPLLDEINLIHNDSIRLFVRAILCKSEDFWNSPSGPTLEGHPIDEFCVGGNVLHTKRVFRVVWLFVQSQQRAMDEADLLFAATLLHDVTKMHKTPSGEYIYDYMHSYTVDQLAESIVQDEEHQDRDYPKSSTLYLLGEEENLSILMRLIRCHRGHNSPIPETIPITSLEWTLHLADQVACQLPSIIDGADVQMWRWTKKDELLSEEDGIDKNASDPQERS